MEEAKTFAMRMQIHGKWMLLEWEFSDDPTTTRIWLDGKTRDRQGK